MRSFLYSCLLGAWLLIGVPSVGVAQLDAPKIEQKAESKKEDPSAGVHYLIAAIATVIVMVLICVPARRE